jgi:2-polyprenyl-6-hydroxyphenyl methylase/3-demethylubiquinone-9 3-methyltransferase
MQAATGTADAAEVRKFDRLADSWWDPDGPMKPLHRMNSLRIGWIAQRVRARFGTLAVRMLDVGCGAGLAAEALARQGADMLGVDAASDAVAAARQHAAPLMGSGRIGALDYRVAAPEDVPETFDVVLALEVIEHVSDRAAFLATLRARVVPGGLLFLSTINRTPKSFLMAKVGAEYVLRWLPPGTHDFLRFVRPAELGAGLRAAGFRVADLSGMVLDPLSGRWRLSRDTAVNYIVMAQG